MYSNDVINEVFGENDIVDYISQYVALKKSGRDYSGLCPFHKEKTPSFHVSRDKQLFHCFGCGASGNLVQFVMRSEGIDFVEALKLLADRAGIVLPEENNYKDYALHERKQKIYEMNKIAARFFHQELVSTKGGKEALDYLKDRKLSIKTIKNYGIGYAPDDYNALHRHLGEMGYTDEELLDAGLAVEKDGRVYDKFRNRVIFPIIDLRGNVIGFGGRIMKTEQKDSSYKPPKYLNSAETPVFNKGKNLFSLNFAKKDNSGKLILVEGYMDVISVYQAGITNVVATLGTALTEDQAKLLSKYCSEILICYDSDEAGQKAAMRAIGIITGAGIKAKIIRLKDAKDPDEYIKKHGVEMFKKAISDATHSTEYQLGLAKSQYNLDIAEGKIQFIQDAAEILGNISDAVEVDAYIKKISAETEISQDAIYSEYKKKKKGSIKKQSQKSVISKTSLTPQGSKDKPTFINTAGVNAEKRLINMISQNEKFAKRAMEILSPESFSNDIYQRIVKIIFENASNGSYTEPAILLNEFSDSDLKIASEIFYNLETYDNDEKAFGELLVSIRKEQIKKQIFEEKDPEKLKKLFEEQRNLSNDNI